MHEVYLWPFANVVRAGVGSVMCAYNRVNNTYACENSNLLNNLLKSEFHFKGLSFQIGVLNIQESIQ